MRAIGSRRTDIDDVSLPDGSLPGHGLAAQTVRVPANGQSLRRAWHDVFAISADCFVISIGDVAGGAAEAVAVRHAIGANFEAPTDDGASGIALTRAMDLIGGRAAAGAFPATALVGIVDARARTFTYSSAGGQAPLFCGHDGGSALLPVDTHAADGNHPPAQVVVDLRGAGALLLYSSALVSSATDPAAGLRRLQGALADYRIASPGGDLAGLAQELLADRAHDEVALVALRFAPRSERAEGLAAGGDAGPGWTVSWSFDATAVALNGARRAFLACLDSKEHGGRAIDLGAAELIYGELLGNVVRHAPGLVDISLDWTADLPVLHVRDSGPGFRSRRSRERLPVDELSESGRGLFIINALAAKFSVSNGNGCGTHASVTLPPA